MAFSFYNKRIVSGISVGLFGLLVVAVGGIWFTFAVQLIVHLALLEYLRMAEFAGIRPASKTTLLSCQLLLLTTYLDSQGILPDELSIAVLPISGAAICVWLLLQPQTGSIADIAASIFGLFYLGYLPSYWIRLRNLSDFDFSPSLESLIQNTSGFLSIGMIITLVACLMIVASDIGSYCFGRNLGRRPLSPISPSKTIEGAVFGVVCSITVGCFSAFFLRCDSVGVVCWGVIGSLVGLFAIAGDLIESMMKRDAGLKDSGNALPGHGGVLDRIDSFLFTPSILFYLIKFLLPILVF